MIHPITYEQIKKVMFEIVDDKSLGPDGFMVKFFKSTCNVVGSDVFSRVRECFLFVKLLRTLNKTILSLIPKTNSPTKVTNFRPISCCNVV